MQKRIGKHNCMYIEPEYEHKQYEYYDMRYNGYRSVDYRNLEPVNSCSSPLDRVESE